MVASTSCTKEVWAKFARSMQKVGSNKGVVFGVHLDLPSFGLRMKVIALLQQRAVLVAYQLQPLSQGTLGDGPTQVVYRMLVPVSGAATSGHVVLLKQKALTALLRRLDVVLYERLLAGVHLRALELKHWKPFPDFCPESSDIACLNAGIATVAVKTQFGTFICHQLQQHNGRWPLSCLGVHDNPCYVFSRIWLFIHPLQ